MSELFVLAWLFFRTQGTQPLPHILIIRIVDHLERLRMRGSFSLFVLARFVDLVDRQFESIVNHPWQQHFENVGAFFEARVGVCLDQPSVELGIDDKIVAEYFETFFPLVWIELLFD